MRGSRLEPEARHMGLLGPLQTQEVVGAWVSHLSPVRVRRRNHTRPTNRTNTRARLSLQKPSNDLLRSRHTRTQTRSWRALTEVIGLWIPDSPEGISYRPQMRGADAKERDTQGSDCMHTKKCACRITG